MWIYDPKRVCNTCGVTDTAFFAQMSKGKLSVNNMCSPCKKKENRKFYFKNEKMRRYLKDKNNIYAEEVI